MSHPRYNIGVTKIKEVHKCHLEQDDQKQSNLKTFVTAFAWIAKPKKGLASIARNTESQKVKQFAKVFICFWQKNKLLPA